MGFVASLASSVSYFSCTIIWFSIITVSISDCLTASISFGSRFFSYSKEYRCGSSLAGFASKMGSSLFQKAILRHVS